jgi:hypothetical protein
VLGGIGAARHAASASWAQPWRWWAWTTWTAPGPLPRPAGVRGVQARHGPVHPGARASDAGTAVTASAFHPGAVATGITRDNALQRVIMKSPLSKAIKAMLLTPEEGAEPLLHLATITDPHTANGAYFDRLDGPMAAR